MSDGPVIFSAKVVAATIKGRREASEEGGNDEHVIALEGLALSLAAFLKDDDDARDFLIACRGNCKPFLLAYERAMA